MQEKKFILVSSWCHYFYQFLFDGVPEIPLLRTTDIDFLVPNPVHIERKSIKSLSPISFASAELALLGCQVTINGLKYFSAIS